MPDFRTHLPPQPAAFILSYRDRVLSLGSCFAEHIGNRLQDLKFDSRLNPFGILYNPVSMGHALERLAEGRPFSEAELFAHREQWHSFAHHGSFSGVDCDETLRRINLALDHGHRFLQEATRLILTLGTAHVFLYRKSGKVVANCHKLPGQEFERRRLSVEEVLTALSPVLQELKISNSGLQIIATVSPVRHIRDGLVENQRSKATLLLALDELARRFDWFHYFPAYELLLDDLRDYRFYSRDMLHPNELAIDYIWAYFANTFFDQPTRALSDQVQSVVTAAGHRPLHSQTQDHRQFVQQQLARIKTLEEAHPFLRFEDEKAGFLKSLVR